MIVVYPLLRQLMRASGTSYTKMASVANIPVFMLHLKMMGLKRWKLTEVLRICCFFRTSDTERLFQKRFVWFVR